MSYKHGNASGLFACLAAGAYSQHRGAALALAYDAHARAGSDPTFRHRADEESEIRQSNFRSQISRTEILHGWLSISNPINPG